jgi:Family of unknown function (DUF6134)
MGSCALESRGAVFASLRRALVSHSRALVRHSVALAGLACAFSLTAQATEPAGDWNFRALLDGEPIGQHRFSVVVQGDERRVTSEARFAVKFLGLTAYRYQHRATEQWRGGCLTALDSTTDDDGKPSRVRAEQNEATFRVVTQADQPAAALKGCVMSFAYWNPAIQSQSQLLNAQTGRYEAVQVQRVGTGSVDVRGKSVAATEFRITGPAQPIHVWYSLQGDWVGLDSVVGGGRKLSYRLQ